MSSRGAFASIRLEHAYCAAPGIGRNDDAPAFPHEWDGVFREARRARAEILARERESGDERKRARRG